MMWILIYTSTYRREVVSWTLCHHAAGIQARQVGTSALVDGEEILSHLPLLHIQGSWCISCKWLTDSYLFIYGFLTMLKFFSAK
jgi:hypothetical protein